jgi:hypothetical protein
VSLKTARAGTRRSAFVLLMAVAEIVIVEEKMEAHGTQV